MSLHAGDFDVGLHPDVGLPGELIHQVLRHACRERPSSHQHGHRLRVLREEQRRLAGGVAAAHQMHNAPLHPERLGPRGPIVDPVADQSLDTGHREPAPLDEPEPSLVFGR